MKTERDIAEALVAGILAWHSNDAYLSAGGNYRLKSARGRIAPWSRIVKHTVDVDTLHDLSRRLKATR